MIDAPAGDEDFTMLTSFPQEPPFEVGSLEPEAFTSLSEWQIVSDPEGSFAYKVGIKHNVRTEDGEHTTLVIFFPTIITPQGETLTEEESTSLQAKFAAFMEQEISEMEHRYGNVTGLELEPTSEMIEELYINHSGAFSLSESEELVLDIPIKTKQGKRTWPVSFSKTKDGNWEANAEGIIEGRVLSTTRDTLEAAQQEIQRALGVWFRISPFPE